MKKTLLLFLTLAITALGSALLQPLQVSAILPADESSGSSSGSGRGGGSRDGGGGGSKSKASTDSIDVRATAGGVSSNCADENDVCAGFLPRTKANDNFVQTVLQIAIGVIAAVSVLFIAIGGLRYVLSQGDPQGVTKAKSTIVYALIGLAIAILAQGIVALVVNVVLK